MSESAFEDLYESLQLHVNADQETIERVYRMMAKRFHPDSGGSSNPERFGQISRAYQILSNPESRAAYDAKHDEVRAHVWRIFDQSSSSDSFKEDKRIFQAVLSLLYINRRQDPNLTGMGIIELEKLLGCPAEHLEFHVWYLKEKGWVNRLENGKLAISADGVDKVVEGDMMLRRDRLLPKNVAESAAPEHHQKPEEIPQNTDSYVNPASRTKLMKEPDGSSQNK